MKAKPPERKPLTVQWVKPHEVAPNPSNPRRHSVEQIKLIEKSIREFGFTAPILIDDKDVIVAGHGRLQAALNLKLPQVPVIRLGHLTPQQVRAYMIADNKLTEMGEWDWEKLREELAALMDEDYDALVTGFSDEEIVALRGGDSETDSYRALFLDDALQESAEKTEARKAAKAEDAEDPPEEQVEITCPHCGGTISLS